MNAINNKVHEFWFESAPARRLGMLRILVGAFVIYYLTPELDEFLQVGRTNPKLFAPVGVIFHGPINIDLYHWILRATLAGAFCFAFGLWHRIAAPIFACLMLWVFCYRQSWSMIYHSDNLVVLHVMILAFTRSADALSL